MVIQQAEQIDVTNDIENKQGLLVTPNFMLVNEPYIKSNKTYIKLIVWMDITSNGIGYDPKEEKPNIILKNFKFTLDKLKSNENNPKDLNISWDSNGKRINNTSFFTYEIETKQFNDNPFFKYTLSYQNDQNIGLTYNGIEGGNRGVITLNQRNGDDKINLIRLGINNPYINKFKLINYESSKIEVNNNKTNYLINKNVDLIKGIIKTDINPYSYLDNLLYLNNIISDSDNTQHDKLKIKEIYTQNKLGKQNVKYKGDLIFDKDRFKLNIANGYIYDYSKDSIIENDNNSICFNDEYNNSLKVNLSYKGNDLNFEIKIDKNLFQVKDRKTNDQYYIKYENLRKNIGYDEFEKYRDSIIDEN